MVLEFATKRDRNGNRYYLGIDTDKKVYSLERGHWYTRDDITEISKKDRHKLIEQIKDDTCTTTDTAATTDTANNDSVTATQDIKTSDNMTQDTTNNAITSETMQADNKQTETTQDIAPKHTATKTATSNNKSVSLFIVKDKPAPVKLPHLKPLNNIPMYVERFKTDFKQRNNARVYKYRVNNKKSLKKAYNDFVGTVSHNRDKCVIGGKVAAGNTS